jgi:hypothetical protein
MTTPLDAPLLDRTDPRLARPLPPALARARVDVLEACGDLIGLPEAALERDWVWTGESDVEARYGAYRAAETLERAEAEARAILTHDREQTRAGWVVAPVTSARWDLHGLLLPLDDRLLDADPGGGEWTVRLTLGHIISSQRAYGWGTAWWLAHPRRIDDPDLPDGVPDELWETLPDETTDECAGTGAEIRARLDDVVDLAAERLTGLSDDRLELAARWTGFPVTIAFRLGRMSSHVREHTIQVEKTLALLGHVPDEPRRLVRHVLATYGRAEAAVFGRRSTRSTESAVARIAAAAAEARTEIASAVEAAGLSP